jgi:hypothetical protein
MLGKDFRMLLNSRDSGRGGDGLALAYPAAARRGAISQRTTRAADPQWVPKPATSRRPRRAADGWSRPAQAADVAQARLFEAILVGEIAELEELVAASETRWRRRCERGAERADSPPEPLVRLRGRVAEAQRLLDALRARFLLDSE